MTWGDLVTLAPLLALTAAAVVVMLAAAFGRSHALALALTLTGLAAAFATLFVAGAGPSDQVTPLLALDGYALFVTGLLLAAAAAVAVLAWGYLRRQDVAPEEFYVLLLTATLGGATLVASTHFASLFLGLEILSVSLYALIVYPVHRREAVEAAVKYLVLAGTTSAFLVFGMALVYAETGTMSASGLAPVLDGSSDAGGSVVSTGLVLILVGIGFKLAVVPFHMWTPDVYQGAPAPVTAYVATVSKGAVVALLLRFFAPVGADSGGALFIAVAGIAIASMVVGNLLALRQDNVKRILAYSSIAHLGYVLVAFLAAGERGAIAVTFYLVAYFATTLAAFGVVTVLSGEERDADRMEDYRGLAARRPGLAATFAVALFSLAGMPLTAGFIGKFTVVAAGADAARWALVVTLVLTSTVGLAYYIRLIVAMYVQRPAEGRATADGHDTTAAGREVPAATPGGASVIALGVLAGLVAFVLAAGVYPAPLIDLIERAVAALP
jgi:NADH-quinone oxidoreductase subunit N